MGILSKIFRKKEKKAEKMRVFKIGGGTVREGPIPPRPNVKPVGQGLSRKEIKIYLDKEDRELIKELIKKYES